VSDADDDRLARVALSRLTEPGEPRIASLAAQLGAVRLREILGDPHQATPEARDVASRLRGVDPVRELEQAEKLGLRYVVPGDEEWPAVLDDLAFAEELQQRGGIPVGLWVRGQRRLDEMAHHAVAVVGSRAATSYGSQLAADIGAGVAAAGPTVVSGAAFGVDFHAHRGALAVEGPTVAVLAGGVDRAYPEKHTPLLAHIARTGLVVSEAPLGAASMRVRFLARNRLIAALTLGTVVVEAAVRSGALSTANWAGRLNRVLMGVPGPVTSASSEGVHELIRARGALLVTDGAEVLEAVAPAGQHTLALVREPARPRDLLTGEQRQVLDAVPVQRGAGAAKIAHTAGLAPARVQEMLADLRTGGFVEHASGRWRLRHDLDE